MLALLVIAMQAAEPSPPAPRFADEVVVTAERVEAGRAETPAAVAVVTGDAARRLPVESLSGLLDQLPGFSVLFGEGYGLTPMVMARGFFGAGEAEYVRLLVDGVPAADAESGLADWRRVRVGDVERVEAVRGPASAHYGDTALGGIVQVFTRHGAAHDAKSAGLALASFGTASGDGTWNGRLGGARLGIEATGSRTDGFRDHSATGEGGASVAVAGEGEAPRVSVRLSGSARGREDPGPLALDVARADPFASDPMFGLDREDARRAALAVAVHGRGPAPWRALVQGSARESAWVRTLLLAPGLGDRARRDLETWSAGLALEGGRTTALGGREARLRAGIEASRDHVSSRYAAVDDAGAVGPETGASVVDRDRLAAFVTGDWRASGRLRLSAAVRFDGLADDAGDAGGGRVTHSAWSPRVGATVQIGGPRAPVSLFVQASRAFKSPTVDQLADARPFPDFAGGTFTISNPLLSPQRAATLEAGVSQRVLGGRWECVLYRTRVEDEIDFDPATFRYANIGRSLHRGVEASASLFEDRALAPRFSYAWTEVRLRGPDAPGGQLKNIPVHTARLGLAARLPAGLGADLRVAWMGRRFADDANRSPLQDAVVVDTRVTRAFGRVRGRLDATNLTDRRWDALGYVLSDFDGGDVTYVFAASGRALRAGIDIGF